MTVTLDYIFNFSIAVLLVTYDLHVPGLFNET